MDNKLVVILGFLLIGFANNVLGTHVAGGEITYDHLANNDYIIKLRVYRDCSGVPLPDSAEIKYHSQNLGIDSSFHIYLVDSFKLQTTCDTVSDKCDSFNSPYLGYIVYQFEDTISLGGQSDDWLFLWNHWARNGNILNTQYMFNSAQDWFTIMSELDNLNTPFNNSVRFPIAFQLLYETNRVYTISSSPVDLDGDSIVVQFTNALGALSGASYPVGTNIWYNTPFSASNPFPTNNGITINSNNGEIKFSASMVGTYIITMIVEEYRNGIKIGSVIRDFQLSFYANQGNYLPEIQNPTNTQVFSAYACPSSPLNISLSSLDSNFTDSTYIYWDSSIANASFTVQGGLNATGTFSWLPDTSDVRAQPYLVTFVTRDNSCPLLGYRSYAYLIYVNHCNTDSVWSGDANGDFICNNYDVLNIGIGNGYSGNLRPNASNNWAAEWCMNWNNSFINNLNFKHADCNGDGLIDTTDLLPIIANYSLVHNKRSNYGQYKILGMPDLFFDIDTVLAYNAGLIKVPIHLGTSTSPMNDFYGIAGTIELQNVNLSSPLSLNSSNSWVGDSSNSILFKRSSFFNEVDFTLVRNNQSNTSGYGRIGELQIALASNNTIGSVFQLKFKNLKLIDKSGKIINDYNVINDSLLVTYTLSTNTISTKDVEIFPNPGSGLFTIEAAKKWGRIENVTVYDAQGSKMQATYKQQQLNVSNLVSGVYFVRITNAQAEVFVERIVIR